MAPGVVSSAAVGPSGEPWSIATVPSRPHLTLAALSKYCVIVATVVLPLVPVIPIYTYTSIQLIDSAVKNFDSNIMNHAYYKDIYLESLN